MPSRLDCDHSVRAIDLEDSEPVKVRIGRIFESMIEVWERAELGRELFVCFEGQLSVVHARNSARMALVKLEGWILRAFCKADIPCGLLMRRGLLLNLERTK